MPLQSTKDDLRTQILQHPTSFSVVDDTDADFLHTLFPTIVPVPESAFPYDQRYRVLFNNGTTDIVIQEDRVRNAYVVFEYNPSRLRRLQMGVLYTRA